MSVIASHIVKRVLEAEPEDIDWAHQPDDPDAPADVKGHIEQVTNADWRWQAWHELVAEEDPDAEQPDLESEDPESVDEFEIELNGEKHIVLRSEDVGEAKALTQVRQDMESEPELFTKDWLENYVNTKRLTELLWSDQRDMLEEQHESDEEWRDFLIENDMLEREDFYTEEEDEELPIDRDLQHKIEEAKEAWIEKQKEDFDGMAWLRDIYGEDEVMAKAIEIAGINYDEAVKDAVNTDGWAHFICRHDGNYHSLKSGAVYYRE